MNDRFSDPAHIEWAKKVKERDDYTCQVCRDGNNLHSHHMYNWADWPNMREDVENGTTLCSGCHHLFHSMFSKHNTTRAQFEDFKRTYQILRQILKNSL